MRHSHPHRQPHTLFSQHTQRCITRSELITRRTRRQRGYLEPGLGTSTCPHTRLPCFTVGSLICCSSSSRRHVHTWGHIGSWGLQQCSSSSSSDRQRNLYMLLHTVIHSLMMFIPLTLHLHPPTYTCLVIWHSPSFTHLHCLFAAPLLSSPSLASQAQRQRVCSYGSQGEPSYWVQESAA